MQIMIKPAKNSIRTADLYSSWSMTDKQMNTHTKCADSNVQRFKPLEISNGTFEVIQGSDTIYSVIYKCNRVYGDRQTTISTR